MAAYPRPIWGTIPTTSPLRSSLKAQPHGSACHIVAAEATTSLCASLGTSTRKSEACLSYIQFLGAAGVVTGSKHLINTAGDESGRNGCQALVDCGLFQGQKEWRERNWQDLPLPAQQVDALILTHAHLDHSGWIPRLVKQGFNGPVYATQATIDLCSILLPDSGHLQEEDAAFYNKTRTSKHVPALPLYTMEEAQECLPLFKPVAFGETVILNDDLSFRFVKAAHILGSAMAEVALKSNGTTSRL